jgi:hypothetical protein
VVKPGTAPVCDPSVAIGTGRQAWESLSDGDELTLVKGSTQGYFFTLSVQQRGVKPDGASICYRGTLLDDGTELGIQCWHVQFLTQLASMWYERLGLMATLYADHWNAPDELLGRDAKIEIYVGDATNCAATAEVIVRIVAPE